MIAVTPTEINTVSIGGAAITDVSWDSGTSTITISFAPFNAGDYFQSWTAEENETVEVLNIAGVFVALPCGVHLYLHITNYATLPRTITFGLGFKSASTLIGTVSKLAVVHFRSNGTNLIEVGRITGITP